MDKTIVIGLSGHAAQFRLDEDAYERLSRYLDRAAVGLQDDPDQAEVLGDLERSVGDKLAALLGSEDRLITAADIDGVLEQIGAVDTGQPTPVPGDETDAPPSGVAASTRTREGQQIAGVCTGLAAYARDRRRLGADAVRPRRRSSPPGSWVSSTSPWPSSCRSRRHPRTMDDRPR